MYLSCTSSPLAVQARSDVCKYNGAIDSYAFGVILWEILTQRPPWQVRSLSPSLPPAPVSHSLLSTSLLIRFFLISSFSAPSCVVAQDAADKWAIINAVQAGTRLQFSPEEVEGAPDGYVELMEQCWSPEPAKRPVFDAISCALVGMELEPNAAQRPQLTQQA